MSHASWCAWLTDSCDCTCTPEDVTGELADRVEALEAKCAQLTVDWAEAEVGRARAVAWAGRWKQAATTSRAGLQAALKMLAAMRRGRGA